MESTMQRAMTGATSHDESETYQTLLARAHRRTGGVPPEVVVRHILEVTAGADWPVRREALEALLRRFSFGKSDGLRIVSGPSGGRLLGLYATQRRGSPARPYRTLLRRVDPVEGSCNCADFLRSSLGLCKHLLMVLEDVASRPRALERAKREPVPVASPLRWDPVRPLTGPGDWLAQVRWADGTPEPGVRRWLRPSGKGGWMIYVPDAQQQRLQLVDGLLEALRNGHGEPALHAVLQEDRRRTERALQGAMHLGRLKDPSALRAWIGQLTRRLCIDRLRGGGREVVRITTI